jgi:hypothetical protein
MRRASFLVAAIAVLRLSAGGPSAWARAHRQARSPHGHRRAAAAAPLKDGQLLYRKLDSKVGVVEVMAETRMSGSTLTLKDVAMYPDKARRPELTPDEVARLRGQLASEARSLGFETLKVTGLAYTGHKPGKLPDVSINLTTLGSRPRNK